MSGAITAAAAAVAAAVLLGTIGAPADAGTVGADVTIAPSRGGDGVAIDVRRISVVQALRTGEVYSLPAFGVRNPGSRSAAYRLRVFQGRRPGGRSAPSDWFRFTPETFVLDSGRTLVVSARLELPQGADAGDYAALVGAQVVPRRDGGRVGAAATARVTFGVESSGGHDVWRRLGAHSLLLPPALLASLLLAWLIRRFALGVARRP